MSMQYDVPLCRVAREMLSSVHLMFRLRSFMESKSLKNIILSVFLLFIINHTHFLKSHLHIFYKSIFYMMSIISNFYKVGLFILFVQCIFSASQ